MAGIAALKDYQQFGVKSEAIEGTEETLVAADYSLLSYDCEIRRVTEQAGRRPVGTSAAPMQSVEARRIAEGKAVIEIASSGSSGTQPLSFPALLSSGAELGAGQLIKWGAESTSVVRGVAATFGWNDGAYRRRAVGARSTLKFRPNDKGFLVAEMAFQGRYERTSGGFVTGVTPSARRPAPCPGSILQLDSTTAQWNEIEIDIGGKLETLEDYSEDLLCGQTLRVEPVESANVVVFETGTPDWEAKTQNLTSVDLLPLQWTLGAGANNQLTFAGVLDVNNVERIYVNAAAAYRITGNFIRNASAGSLYLAQS
jgi:hypothetical protein